jgi:hypothetical protein
VCSSILGDSATASQEYIDALLQSRNFQAAAKSAYTAWQMTRDPAFLRTYIDACSRYDLPGAIETCAGHIEDCTDVTLIQEYIRLLQSEGRTHQALEAAAGLRVQYPGNPAFRLVECDLLAATGDKERALAHYEHLVKDEIASKNNMEELGRILGRYRRFVADNFPAAEAERRFLALVSSDVNVASLLETARFYDESGRSAEARSWYYRAYRADFLAGGPDYAHFLARCGDDRECEKVMLYILSNVKKGADLTRIASLIVREGSRMRTMKRLTDRLVRTMVERRASLATEGLELLAIAFFLAASNALDENDYAGCKYFCLCGLDVIPAYTREIRLGDFLPLIRRAKEQSPADRPVMHDRPEPERSRAGTPAESVVGQLGLNTEEEKIVAFLRSHRTASEMELRALLGTRRVVGIINRLVQKAASQGVAIIGKKGMGEDGEIYEYIGT